RRSQARKVTGLTPVSSLNAVIESDAFFIGGYAAPTHQDKAPDIPVAAGTGAENAPANDESVSSARSTAGVPGGRHQRWTGWTAARPPQSCRENNRAGATSR